jgi:INO80 complex subunit B
MTARQRAMLERKGDALPDPAAEQLLALPTGLLSIVLFLFIFFVIVIILILYNYYFSNAGYREKVMTPEMIKKAALKSQKRKQLLDEKREKDKVVYFTSIDYLIYLDYNLFFFNHHQ